MASQTVTELSVPRTFSAPGTDQEELQVEANQRFNGNVSLALRWAIFKTYGIGDGEASRPLR